MIILDNYAPVRGTKKELGKATNIDTFYTLHSTDFFPKQLVEDVRIEGYYICGNLCIGGKMTTSVEPHVDDVDKRLSHSLIYFPYYDGGYLNLFLEGKWYEVKEGDAFIGNTNKVHAVLEASNKTWYYMSCFVTKKAKYKDIQL